MTPKFATDAAIEALARGVIDCTLPHADWTHAAHFAFALWLSRNRPGEADAEHFRRRIIALNDSHGTANTDTSGYHHTITIASLGAAQHVLGQHEPFRPLYEVLEDLLDSRFGRSDWILAHWSRELLFSVPARRNWVAPDLAPLPW